MKLLAHLQTHTCSLFAHEKKAYVVLRWIHVFSELSELSERECRGGKIPKSRICIQVASFFLCMSYMNNIAFNLMLLGWDQT